MGKHLKFHKKLMALTVLAGLSTLSLHCYNKLETLHATYLNILSAHSPEKKDLYYEWRFGKIRYTKTGSGSPLLLMHDLTPGSSSYEFSKIISGLSNQYEVYCIDFLGYGKSDKPFITYTNYLYVQLITDFIKNVIARKTSLIASGNAVPVAIMACHNDKEIIHNIVAINPQDLFSLSKIPSKRNRVQKMILEIPIVGTFLYNLFTRKAKIAEYFQENYYNPDKVEENDILAYTESAHIGGYRAKYAYASYRTNYMNSNIVHALKQIDNSIIIIASEGKENNHTIVDNYVYYNPAIETAFVARSKQLLLLERPDIVFKHIQIYL